LDDVGWYASSYMLTNCAVQLLYGRIYKFYSTKCVFLGCIGIFEVGSAICGAAPNSISFIIGRSIAGLGSAGIFSGSMMVMLHTVPLHRRPIFAGFFGATFGISSVIAPLLGGVFTDKASWRWCFYINLPIGAATIIIIALLLKVPDAENGKVKGLSLQQRFLQLDPLGTACLVPGIVCLILALQWGGTTYAWGSGRVIVLLVIFAILFAIFIGIQAWKKDDALVPVRIAMHRSIAAGALFTFSTAGSMVVIIYYLSIWFQAIKGVTALESGIRLIPTILALSISSTVSGFITSKIGYYVPAMIFTSVASSIATGLMTTFTPETNHASWIGFQVLYGLGLGSARQVSGLAAQAVLPRSDVAIGTAVLFFWQGIGGVVFVSAAQSLFLNSLIYGVAGIPGLDARTILNTGATALQTDVAPQNLKALIVAYNHAVTRPFVLATCVTCLSIIGSLSMEWKNIKGMRRGGSGGAQGDGKEAVKV
jgi:MFS family permease